MELIQTLNDLHDYLKDIRYEGPMNLIAVEALIFNSDDKLVLLLRGPGANDEKDKLEGVGGRLMPTDNGDLLVALSRKIESEIGAAPDDPVKVRVKPEELLEVRIVDFKNIQTGEWGKWVVVSHLCRLEEGTPFNRAPEQHREIKYLSLDDLFGWQTEPTYDMGKNLLVPGLSKSLIEGRKVYKKKYENLPYHKYHKLRT